VQFRDGFSLQFSDIHVGLAPVLYDGGNPEVGE